MSAAYGDDYADVYDLVYREKPYDEEAAFLVQCLRAQAVGTGSRILELACGTGQHAVRLAKCGYAITATDYSAGMAEQVRIRARREELTIDVVQCDMRDLQVPPASYDAVICLFDSIGYVETDMGVGAVFDGVRRSLRADGVFIVEFLHAPAMTNGFTRLRVRRHKTETRTLIRISETDLERERALAHVDCDVYVLGDDRTYQHIKERFVMRYFDVEEMACLARQHGFVPLAAYDGFRAAPVTDSTWHVVAVWKRGRED